MLTLLLLDTQQNPGVGGNAGNFQELSIPDQIRTGLISLVKAVRTSYQQH